MKRLVWFGFSLVAGFLRGADSAENLPNILWITSEDNGPQLGCYGDAYATTPNLDALAAKGVMYLHAWSSAPVCAPARTAIISGVYPPSLGAEHMRSQTRMPAFMRMYPQLLRDRGYYCTNNEKEDYNLAKPGPVWDESSGKAHWKNRAPNQPFFAIFNHTVSHESQIRKRPHTPVHDPAKVRVPVYHPDTPEVRLDWAQYYDQITEMDAGVGENLRELEEAGLADQTIVFYYGDHGSGMPRSKRWPYNSGLHVPLIVYIPPAFRHLASEDYVPGGRSERLVDFTDLAPTLLSLAGVKPPPWMQGRAFLGSHEADPRDYLYGFRGRMDERIDMVRSVRDQRYLYIRNYMPHQPYGQHVAYMFQTPTTQIWKHRYDEGTLQPPQTFFWETKPPEELYDLQADRDEVNNLVHSPDHQKILRRLRRAHQDWVEDIRDLGFLPEEEIHSRSESSTPYEYGHNKMEYPLRRILKIAQTASSLDQADLSALLDELESKSSTVRYWAALGILMRGRPAVETCRETLRATLHDPSPSVRVIAAEALGRYGRGVDCDAAMPVLLEAANLDLHSVYVAILALNAIDALDDKAAPYLDRLEALPRDQKGLPARMNSYVPRLLDTILDELKPTPGRP